MIKVVTGGSTRALPFLVSSVCVVDECRIVIHALYIFPIVLSRVIHIYYIDICVRFYLYFSTPDDGYLILVVNFVIWGRWTSLTNRSNPICYLSQSSDSKYHAKQSTILFIYSEMFTCDTYMKYISMWLYM